MMIILFPSPQNQNSTASEPVFKIDVRHKAIAPEIDFSDCHLRSNRISLSAIHLNNGVSMDQI